nr:PREDICTED: uncharacterized protein LOC103277987 [Anolis carolinensis]XP_008103688.1 PREDICTED: uncharacterized protein LOC103277987 [Anolis carolinensis]|eukprot:XP_008103687.1 PREDICTED: uncharacterized protein LOC103277987 [Anolis carolinensis]
MAAVRRSRRKSRLLRKRKQTIRKRRMQLLRRRKQAMRRRKMKLARRRKLALRRRKMHKKRQQKSRKAMVKRGTRGRKMRSQPKKSPKQSMRRNSEEFVSKVLRQLQREKVPISTKTKGKMTSFIRKLYNKLASKARSSKHGQVTIGTKDLQKVLKHMMHNEHGMELVQTIQKASHRH